MVGPMIARQKFPLATVLILLGIGSVCALLLVIAERIGSPPAVTKSLSAALFISIAVLAGASVATMRPSLFFAGGREGGVFAGGVAILALVLLLAWSSAGTFAGGTLIDPGGILVLLPAIASIMIATIAIGPAIRRSGAFTLADYLRVRFASVLPHALMTTLIILVLGLAAMEAAALATSSLRAVIDLDRETATVMVAILVAAMICPGGVRSLHVGIAIIGVCLIAGLLIPIVATYLKMRHIPLGWSTADEALQFVQARAASWLKSADARKIGLVAAQLRMETVPEAAKALPDMLAAAMGGGVVLVASGIQGSSRKAGAVTGSALFSILLLAAIPVLAAATASGAILGIDLGLTGARTDALPLFVTDGQLDGLVSLCGRAPSDTELASWCGGFSGKAGPGPATITTSNITIVDRLMGDGAAAALGLPIVLSTLYRLAPFYLGLAAMALCGMALAATLSHTVIYRGLQPSSVTSARLALARLAIVLVMLAASGLAEDHAFDAALWLRAAMALAAATLLPLLYVSLLPRAGAITALLTILGGGAVAAVFLAQSPSATTPASLYGFAGAIVMACAGLASRPSTPAEQGFAHRLFDGRHEPLIIDRGA